MEKYPRQPSSYDPIYIKAWLYNEQCRVTFKKKDGSQRTMLCTLNPKYLPEQSDWEEQTQRQTSNSHVIVWDLEKHNWRTFRYDSVLEFLPVIQPSNDFDYE